jgi:ABC-type glycerol-3-phosphate transport system substrate-binding protein
MVFFLSTGFLSTAFSQEKAKINLLSHRHPILEFYAKQMDNAIEGVKVEGRLVPYDKCLELARIGMSGGQASPNEILYANSPMLTEFAENGWLLPLENLIAKYDDKYHFYSDIPKAAWEAVSYKGHIYGMPTFTNLLLFFYRTDLFEKYKLEPPKTFDQFLHAAKTIQENEKNMYGTTLTLKRTDSAANAFHSYLHGYGGKWYEEDGKPAFNGPAGIKAVKLIKELMKYAPPGVLSYANDESMVAFQQEMVAMGLQWLTRTNTMDDPKVSKVVGKIGFAVPPNETGDFEKGVPASLLSVNCYVIPKNLEKNIDHDLVFRVLAEATDTESMTEAAKYAYVPRISVTSRKDLVNKNRAWPATNATIAAGAVDRPKISAFMQLAERITLKIHQALTGDLEVEEALDQAANEVTELIKK